MRADAQHHDKPCKSERHADPYCECGLSLRGLEPHERERHRMGDRHLRRMAEEERDRLEQVKDHLIAEVKYTAAERDEARAERDRLRNLYENQNEGPT